MRIPTLLGIALLLIAVFLGGFIYYANQKPILNSYSTNISSPNNIQVVNITDTQASIIWQTNTPSTGLVSWGDSDSLGQSQNDIRDPSNPQPHLMHFITLTNLKPTTTYYFKVRSNLNFYPDQAQSFTTTPSNNSTDKYQNKSIFGVILDSDLKPVDEALVVLTTNQTADLATLTTSAGNFLLPLVNLKTKDLKSDYLISSKIPAQLTIYSKSTPSIAKFTLPLEDKPLPKIILGQDNDFTQLTATFSAQLQNPQSPTAPQNSNPFDLNGDGKLNTLDLAVILQHIGEKSTDPNFFKSADLNHDGIIDQQDLDIEKKALR